MKMQSFPELEEKVKKLQAKKAEWTQLSLAKKVDLLKQALDRALPLIDEVRPLIFLVFYSYY